MFDRRPGHVVERTTRQYCGRHHLTARYLLDFHTAYHADRNVVGPQPVLCDRILQGGDVGIVGSARLPRHGLLGLRHVLCVLGLAGLAQIGEFLRLLRLEVDLALLGFALGSDLGEFLQDALSFLLLRQFGHALLLLFFLRLLFLLGLLLGDLGDLFLILQFRLRHRRGQHPHRRGRRRLGFRLGFFLVLRRGLLRVFGCGWRRRSSTSPAPGTRRCRDAATRNRRPRAVWRQRFPLLAGATVVSGWLINPTLATPACCSNPSTWLTRP